MAFAENAALDKSASRQHDTGERTIGHRDMSVTLRMGIMCTGTVFEHWQASCVRQVLAVPGVELAVLIVDNASPPIPEKRKGKRRLLSRRLFDALALPRLQSRLPIDLSAQLTDAPRLFLATTDGEHVQACVGSNGVARIREHRLDFILRFTDVVLGGEVLDAARWGIWSYRHGNARDCDEMPSFVRELSAGEPIVNVALLRHLNDGSDMVLHQGCFKSVPKSYARTRDAAFNASAGFVARVCRQLIAGSDFGSTTSHPATAAPVASASGNVQMLTLAATVARNRVTDLVQRLFVHDQWNIGIVDAPIASFLDPAFVPEVQWLPGPPRGHIAADPFALRRGEVTSILYEALDDRDQRGRIFAFEVRDGGKPSPPREVITASVHLSYPYLLEDEGEVYCIPEMAQSDELLLFRATAFPWQWQRVATLLRGIRVLDASVFRHDGRWWMIGAIKGDGDCVELHAWHAERIAGPWRNHACNPLKIDVRCARPGGTPFVHDGALYRPAQDLSHTYGGRLLIQRIDELTPDRFAEHTAAAVAPRPGWPYPAGLHTLCAAGDKTIIDAKRRYFSPYECGWQLRRMAGRAQRTKFADSVATP